MKKYIAYFTVLCTLLFCIAACGKPAEEAAYSDTVRIGAMAGPTAMGFVKLMSDNENGICENSYEFKLQSDSAAFTAALLKGEIDIAALPANLASVIYNNSNGSIKLLAINTLGVLNIVERGDSVHSISDLAGRTVYATGEGAVPEYTLRYLLKENGIVGENEPDICWCADTSEVLSRISTQKRAIAMLPQPFATAAMSKTEGLRIAIDLNSEWEKLNNGSLMITGVLAVRSEFAENHPKLLEKFILEYEKSVQFVLNNNSEAAELIEHFEIVKAAVALKALPYCNITFMTGENMKSAMEKYLNVLYGMNKSSIGEKLPDGEFYYGT